MPIIVNKPDFNASALQASDLYVRIIPPPGFVRGEPTDVLVVLGTASWGPKNQPILNGSPNDIASNFGGVTADAAADPFDLCTDAQIAFSQARSAGLSIYGIRISDGTDAAATYTLLDTSGTPKNGLVLTGKHTGKLGNNIRVLITDGSKTGTYTVTIVPFSGGRAEVYPNIAYSTPGDFWNSLKSAINNGMSGLRGPSELVVGGAVDATAIAPALGTFALTGGTDGRASVAAANFIGSDTAMPKTGIYAVRGLTPSANIIICAGLTDTTVYATLQALVEDQGMVVVLPFAKGTSTASAISSKKTLGIDSPNVIFCKDWVQWFDTGSGQTRYVPPTAFVAGRIACLAPEISPTNKEVYGVVGTERQDISGGNLPYSPAEVGQLQKNGIVFITNPVPGGRYWGIRHGMSSSSDPVRAPIEYARMTNYLAHSLADFMGKFVGENQTTRVNDALRGAVKGTLDSFLMNLKQSGQIDDFITVCDLTNNTPELIAQHFLRAALRVRYMSSVQFFIVDLQGGTTVVTIGNQVGEGLAA
ncbi:MAG: hypothetical protein K2W95_15715 [Candidatus Obscuribacterales bacterium]|nr:hypothetical protein [Candidatus Obscuribacterales bacterium]